MARLIGRGEGRDKMLPDALKFRVEDRQLTI